jgi:hypothetical protein
VRGFGLMVLVLMLGGLDDSRRANGNEETRVANSRLYSPMTKVSIYYHSANAFPLSRRRIYGYHKKKRRES